jgi:hypothetical protein
MGMHLWYLEALFLFSLLCLPLFLWLRSHPAGHRVLQRAGDALARPGSLYLLALPPYILINVLDPETWGMDAIGGWSIFIYLTFFVSGFVIYSNARLQDRIRRARWVSLAGGIVLWAGIDPLWGALGDPNFATWQFALGTIPWCLNAWCWLLAILGFGMERLGFRTPFLAYANETTLPFYILHQTVLLTLAFPIVCWPIPDGVKFLTVLIGTFVTVMALYEFAVRRSNLLRILFGMKPLPRPAAERRRRLAEQAA